MKQTDFTGIVPEQYTGNEIEAIASVELKDAADAIAFYTIAKGRLLDVNSWHKTAGISAEFQLVDANCEEVARAAVKGDYLRIDIPGPGSSEGDGYDWVRIDELKEVAEGDHQSIGFRVRPSRNPFSDKPEIAHFYSAEASSSFIVTREQAAVSAWVIDRNIKPNDHAASWVDKIRDTAAGIGAIGMFSKLQWQNLANGLVEKDD